MSKIVFRRLKSIRCVFIILRIFRPLPGLSALAWAVTMQVHARKTVGHLGKNVYAQLDNLGRKQPFFGPILYIKIYIGRYIRTSIVT